MSNRRIAVIGGTGPQGRGLAFRFARAGHSVVIGSRSGERARLAAAEIRSRLSPAAAVTGHDNAGACEDADVALLAVPYKGHSELVSTLRVALHGKIAVSCVNPLGFDKSGPYHLAVPDCSAAEEAQRLLPDSSLVGAFHHLSAGKLWSDCSVDDEDVLVCGNDRDANGVVIELSRAINGRDGLEVGPLRLARQLEPLTAVLISVNKRYGVRSGVRLTGVPVPAGS